MMGMLPLEMAVPTLAGTAAKSTSSWWMGAWVAGERCGAGLPKCSLCPQPLLLFPPQHPSQEGLTPALPASPACSWMWILQGGFGGRGQRRAGISQLTPSFCTFPDVTFSFLCLFSSALPPAHARSGSCGS